METISIPVTFKGSLTVSIPKRNPEYEEAARKMAVAQALASIENPNIPIDEVTESLAVELNASSRHAEHLLSNCQVTSISGVWEEDPIPLMKEHEKLLEFLKSIEFPEDGVLEFSEDSDPENLNALEMTVPEGYGEDFHLYFGGPRHEYDGTNCIAISSTWHGKGKGNARTLADEVSFYSGEVFRQPLTLKNIQNAIQKAHR